MQSLSNSHLGQPFLTPRFRSSAAASISLVRAPRPPAKSGLLSPVTAAPGPPPTRARPAVPPCSQAFASWTEKTSSDRHSMCNFNSLFIPCWNLLSGYLPNTSLVGTCVTTSVRQRLQFSIFFTAGELENRLHTRIQTIQNSRSYCFRNLDIGGNLERRKMQITQVQHTKTSNLFQPTNANPLCRI